jgi:hypothetical protein
VMVVYLHEAVEHKLQDGRSLTNADVEAAVIEGAVQRLRPKLMTVCAVLASLVPILWDSGIGSDVMKPGLRPLEMKAYRRILHLSRLRAYSRHVVPSTPGAASRLSLKYAVCSRSTVT